MDPNLNSTRSINRQGKRKELKLDYVKLQEDLQRDLESDKRYWIQNEAKIRAVSNSATYEDFRQVVLAAHLKPLDKKDKNNLGPEAAIHNKVVWNTAAHNSPGLNDLKSTCMIQRMRSGQGQPIRIEEFVIDWRKMGDDSELKLAFLQTLVQSDDSTVVESPCPSETCVLKRIFTNEVPVDVLPNILEIIHTQFVEKTVDLSVKCAVTILKVLQIIAETKRFEFTLIFLSSVDLERLKSIFDKIKADLNKSLTKGSSEIDDDEIDKLPNQLNLLLSTVKTKYRKFTG